MAIVIPSSKTYDRQNPKVRDNVIERVEVNAIEVLPNNEYETPVYNSNISFDLSSLPIIENTNKEKYESTYNDMFETLEYDGGYVYFDNKVKYLSSTIIIPKLYNNSLISKLYYGKDNENKDEVKYSLILNKTKKTVNANVKLEYKTAQLISKSYGQLVDEGNKTQDDLKLPITIKNTEGGVIVSVEGLQNETNMTVDFAEYENEYHLSYKVLVYMYAEWYTGGYYNVMGNPGYPTQTITAKGFVEEYTPLKLEITVYGNTIGIDLTDKTVYINGEAQKKVHSVDGNELMQTSNYLLDNGKNAIKTMYEETRKEYEVGKETATIRCSIGDYYDYNNKRLRINANQKIAKEKNISLVVPKEKNVSNAPIISVNKNSIVTVKNFNVEVLPMSFKLYDQVIPMVYGADGKDRPMSLYQDGTPKVFQVLGSKIYYDGAVWQELSLQEVDKSEVL